MAAVPSPRAAFCAAATKVRFGWAVPSGMVGVCRTIIPHDGGTSSTWSEHSWGNAFDVAGSASQMAMLMGWLEARRSFFQINNLIGPGSAVNVVHVDFLPSHAGTVPPCAGGPAVSLPTTTGKQLPGATNCPRGQIPCAVNGRIVCAPSNEWCRQAQRATQGGFGSIGTAITDTAKRNLPDWFGKLGRWLEVAGGGTLMVVGLGVLVFAATGKMNVAVKAASGPIGLISGSRVSEREFDRRQSALGQGRPGKTPTRSLRGAESRYASTGEDY